jgi:hypothetical protein
LKTYYSLYGLAVSETDVVSSEPVLYLCLILTDNTQVLVLRTHDLLLVKASQVFRESPVGEVPEVTLTYISYQEPGAELEATQVSLKFVIMVGEQALKIVPSVYTHRVHVEPPPLTPTDSAVYEASISVDTVAE